MRVPASQSESPLSPPSAIPWYRFAPKVKDAENAQTKYISAGDEDAPSHGVTNLSSAVSSSTFNCARNWFGIEIRSD